MAMRKRSPSVTVHRHGRAAVLETEAWLKSHQEEFYLHNTYLEILVQHGLLGIGLYAWIVIDLLRLGQHAGKTTLHGQFLDRPFQSIWSVFVLVYLLNASFVVMNYQFVNGLLFTVAGMLAAPNRRAHVRPMSVQSTS